MPEPTYVLQPTSRLVWAQSAVVGTVESVTVNRARLSTPHRQHDARAFETEVNARDVRNTLSRADTTTTANRASLDALLEEKAGRE